MKQKPTPLVDDYLKSLQGIKQTELSSFFYTRLLSKIEKHEYYEWTLPFKPVWLIGMLTLLLIFNVLTFTSKSTVQKKTTSSSIDAFAESYDLAITPAF